MKIIYAAVYIRLLLILIIMLSAPLCRAGDRDMDAVSVQEAEYEALVTALDSLGLSLDSPEVKIMDPGEVWRYIDETALSQAHMNEDAGNPDGDGLASMPFCVNNTE